MHASTQRALGISLLLAALGSTLPAQRNFVVAPSGGTHTTLQAAANAAASGDLILVIKDGAGETRIAGKALTILGVGASPEIGPLTWTQHPKGQRSRLRNLILRRDSTAAASALMLQGEGDLSMEQVSARESSKYISLSGHVSLQFCYLSGLSARSWPSFPGTSGLTVSGASLLTMDACSVQGGQGEGSLPPGVALHLKSTRAELTRCGLRGGGGGKTGFSYNEIGYPGADGIHLDASRMRLRGSSADSCAGGSGATYMTWSGYRRASDGYGVRCTNGSQLLFSGIQLEGQARYSVDQSSTARELAPTDPYLSLDSGFLLNKSAQLELSGSPGRVMVVLLATRSARIELPFGSLYVDLSTLLHTFPALLDASGKASLGIATGQDLDLLRSTLFLQAVELASTPSPTIRLTGLSSSVPSFW